MYRQITSAIMICFISVSSILFLSCGGGGGGSGSDSPSDAECVAEDKAGLSVIYAGSDSASSVTQNITLPATGDNGTVIIWQSDNTAVAIDGIVTRPSYTNGDATVTLKAIITKGNASDTETFTLTVIKAPVSDTECVAQDKSNLAVIYAGGDSASRVTQKITLPTAGSSGTTIIWQSGNNDVIAINGIVTRPSYTNGDAAVTLKATITKGSASDIKTFTLTVIKAPVSDTECVAQDKANLTVIYAGSDSALRVTQKITLPAAGSSGTTITWQSDNNDVIAINGTVTRPPYTGSNTTVELTATITKGSVSDTKIFTVTVAKEPNVKLASISVLKGQLQPAFSPNTIYYIDAPVPFSDSAAPAYNDTQSAGITATAADSNAIITINGTSVQSGNLFTMNNLKVGKNTAVITVSADGENETKTYTVEVYRAIPVFKTGQTSTDPGVSWPSPRFTDNGDGTVTDKMTGLMWIKNANAIKTLYPDFDHQPATGWGDGMVTWAKALEFIGKINDGTFNCGATTAYIDWRMPNVREMRILLLYSQDFSLITGAFTNAAILRDDFYFTSTTDPANTAYAITTNFYQSSINGRPNSTLNYVWPVRSAP